MDARAEPLQAAVPPADLAHLAIGWVRGHGGARLGVVGTSPRCGARPEECVRTYGRGVAVAAALAMAQRPRNACMR
ncbi:hypothetical protein [Xanthomonas translucens]